MFTSQTTLHALQILPLVLGLPHMLVLATTRREFWRTFLFDQDVIIVYAGCVGPKSLKCLQHIDSRGLVVRIPKFKCYTLTNVDGWSHEVLRHDRQEANRTVHIWTLRDGRKLEPTADGHLGHAETGMLFVLPVVYDDEDEPD